MAAKAPGRLSIHDLPETDRPRERLLRHGPGSLSSAELLAVILRSGTAEENALQLSARILAHFDGPRRLAGASAGELRQFHGLGNAKIAQILAALELGRRATLRPGAERPTITRPADAAALLSDMEGLDREQVRVLLLDSGRRLIAIQTVYVGTLDATALRVSEVFRDAITHNAGAIILAHNHPSGDPMPSVEDVEITRQVARAGRLLDIPLADHMVVADGGWRSLRSLGLGFEE